MAECTEGQLPFAAGYGPYYPTASASVPDLLSGIQAWFDAQYPGTIVDTIEYVDPVAGGLNVGTITVEPGYPGYAWEVFITEVCTPPSDPAPETPSPDAFLLICIVVVAMFFAGIAGFRQGSAA